MFKQYRGAQFISEALTKRDVCQDIIGLICGFIGVSVQSLGHAFPQGNKIYCTRFAGGMAADNGEILMLDTGHNRVHCFGINADENRIVNHHVFGNLDSPTDILVNNKRRYISERSSHRVSVFQGTNLLFSFQVDGSPHTMSLFQNRIYILTTRKNVLSYSLNGDFCGIALNTNSITWNCHFDHFTQIVVNENGFFLANRGLGVISQYNQNGQFVMNIGHELESIDDFLIHESKFYVCNGVKKCVQVFDSRGNFIKRWNVNGSPRRIFLWNGIIFVTKYASFATLEWFREDLNLKIN